MFQQKAPALAYSLSIVIKNGFASPTYVYAVANSYRLLNDSHSAIQSFAEFSVFREALITVHVTLQCD